MNASEIGLDGVQRAFPQAGEAAPGAGHGMREQVGVLVSTRNVAEVEIRRVRAVTAPFAAILPRALSLTALMEPPMFALMGPLTGADLGSGTG